MNDPTERFDNSFRITFCVIWIWTMSLGLIVSGLIDIAQSHQSTCSILCLAETVAITSAVEVVLVGLVNAYFKVYVNKCGLRLPDVWGTYHDVNWADIRSVETFNLGGLKYLRLKSNSIRQTLWLALFLSNMKRFTELVAEDTDSTNPLNEFFNQTLG